MNTNEKLSCLATETSSYLKLNLHCMGLTKRKPNSNICDQVRLEYWNFACNKFSSHTLQRANAKLLIRLCSAQAGLHLCCSYETKSDFIYYLMYFPLFVSSWIFTFWKQLEHQILGFTSNFTASIAALHCMQNTLMQYLVICFIGDRYFKYLKNWVSCVFKIQDSFNTWDTHWKNLLNPVAKQKRPK